MKPAIKGQLPHCGPSRHPDGRQPHQRGGVDLPEKGEAERRVLFSEVTLAGCGKTKTKTQDILTAGKEAAHS